MTQVAIDSPSNKVLLNRTNLILLALVVVQAAVVAYIYWSNNSVPAEDLPLLGELDASDVTALVITSADEETIRLDRTSDGWVVASAGNYPATASKIDEIVGKLVAVKTNRLVTNTAGSHKRLKVADDDFNSKIELTTANGSQTLLVGTAPSSGATHVRLSGQDETFLTSEVASWELNPQASNWIDTLYVDIPQDEVVSMTLENGNGTFEFARENSDSAWTLAGLAEGESLDESKVTTLLGRVVNVRMTEPLGTEASSDYGMDAPQATITLTSKDAEGAETTHTLYVGSKSEEENSYVFKSAASDFYVTVSSFTGDALTDQTREDLLVALEADMDALPADDAASAPEGAPVTDTDIVTPSDAITGTSAITQTDSITQTDTITHSDVITETGTVSDTGSAPEDPATPTPNEESEVGSGE